MREGKSLDKNGACTLRGCWKGAPADSQDGSARPGANSHDCSENCVKVPVCHPFLAEASLPCQALRCVLENFSRWATVPAGQRRLPAVREPRPVRPERGEASAQRGAAVSEDHSVTEVVLLVLGNG